MDDLRTGQVLRSLRRRAGFRQSDLAATTGVSTATVSRAERGHLDTLSIATVRRLFAAVDARIEVSPRWRGGDVDRLLDLDHAHVSATAAAMLRAYGWAVLSEVTFSVYGERGSIDLVGLHAGTGAAVAIEIKTSIASAEELQRRLDVKARLLPGIVRERFDRVPTHMGRLIVIDDDRTNRRRIERLLPLLSDSLPARTAEVRRWLQRPVGPMSGICFLTSLHGGNIRQPRGGRHRVRRPRPPRREADATAAEREHGYPSGPVHASSAVARPGV